MEKRTTETVRADSRIFGLYDDFASLRAGVDNLKALRFCNNDISVLFPETTVSKSFLPEGDSPSSDERKAFIGGTLGWLTYVRPERVGIVSAALVNLGVPEYEADLYETSLRGGRLLVCVRSAKHSLESVMKAISLAGAQRVIAVRPSAPTTTSRMAWNEALFDERLAASAFIS